ASTGRPAPAPPAAMAAATNGRDAAGAVRSSWAAPIAAQRCEVPRAKSRSRASAGSPRAASSRPASVIFVLPEPHAKQPPAGSDRGYIGHQPTPPDRPRAGHGTRPAADQTGLI